jgi:cbb3-type cytochrome c oxidase subunit III
MTSAQANKLLLLGTSLATLALLVVAAARENVLREWRQTQHAYRAALPADLAASFEIQLRQVYVPALRASDRCISCHVGMAPGETGLDGRGALFEKHPDVVHDPLQYGCVVCHGGQGRATERADAHGAVPHWPEPMLPRRFTAAGCGSCHTHLAVPNLVEVERGRALVERYDCLACHAIDGRGGTVRPGGPTDAMAPALSRVGASGFDPAWHEKHVARRAAARDGPWRTSVGEIPAAERAAIETYLGSRVGAPGLVEAKAVFHSLGCRGCHKVGGVGGDDGPDLTQAGEKDPGRLDFRHVPGERSVAGWFAEHFRAPATVVPGSLMPVLGLTERQIDQLVLYTLSLRHSDFPEAFWPRDRIRAERFGAREFATDGATLYGTFCAACHGPRGEGMRYPGMPAFPAVGNPDFLALASDRFIAATVRHGRPGRRMPAWGEKDGGLRPAEIDAVVAHVRALGAGIASPADGEPAHWVRGDVVEGGRLYAEACAACHGARGEGNEGPALDNPGLLRHATDRYLVETIRRGRRGTSMPAFGAASPAHRLLGEREIESVVTFVRTWEGSS